MNGGAWCFDGNAIPIIDTQTPKTLDRFHPFHVSAPFKCKTVKTHLPFRYCDAIQMHTRRCRRHSRTSTNKLQMLLNGYFCIWNLLWAAVGADYINKSMLIKFAQSTRCSVDTIFDSRRSNVTEWQTHIRLSMWFQLCMPCIATMAHWTELCRFWANAQQHMRQLIAKSLEKYRKLPTRRIHGVPGKLTASKKSHGICYALVVTTDKLTTDNMTSWQ